MKYCKRLPLTSGLGKFWKKQALHIASGKGVSTEIKDCLITADKREKMMLKYIQKINHYNFTDSMTMDVIKKYKIVFLRLAFKLRYREKNKQKKLE